MSTKRLETKKQTSKQTKKQTVLQNTKNFRQKLSATHGTPDTLSENVN